MPGSPGAEGQAIREQTFGQALSEAFSHRSYLLLTAGFFVCGFHVAFVTAHLPPYIVDRGLDPRIGAWSLALIGLFNVIGSLAAGYIGQNYSKPIFLSLIYLARAVLIALFVLLPTTPAVRAHLRRGDRAPVALHRAADLGPRRHHVRAEIHGRR